ncbi:MAG: GIY-YIG nuclease family protein [Gammaproteobacteria bacterium]
MHAGIKSYYVYLLECRGGRLYAGITTDLERRFGEHRGGRKGARFTRANPPTKLLAARQVPNRSAALRLEAALRKLRRPGKLAWAELHRTSQWITLPKDAVYP